MIDITDESYESDLSEEESNKLLLLCGHAVGPQLSPAAQAVLDAFRTSHTGQGCLAAALRAAADQVVPVTTDPRLSTVRWELIKIAAELEGNS